MNHPEYFSLASSARSGEQDRIYISTGHVGLFHKYGFTCLRDMPDPSGVPCRVYPRDL